MEYPRIDPEHILASMKVGLGLFWKGVIRIRLLGSSHGRTKTHHWREGDFPLKSKSKRGTENHFWLKASFANSHPFLPSLHDVPLIGRK